jgi:hypothetical protein
LIGEGRATAVALLWTMRKFQNRVISIANMSRRVALRHSNIFVNARNPFTAV